MTDDRLTGSIGMVFLGESSQDIADHVRDALQGSGAERANVATLREPVDLAELATNARDTRYAEIEADDPDLDLVEELGYRLGIQYVLGGRLLERESEDLFSSLAGGLDVIQGVVVVRDQPGDLEQARERRRGTVSRSASFAGCARAACASSASSSPPRVRHRSSGSSSAASRRSTTSSARSARPRWSTRSPALAATSAASRPPTRCSPSRSQGSRSA